MTDNILHNLPDSSQKSLCDMSVVQLQARRHAQLNKGRGKKLVMCCSGVPLHTAEKHALLQVFKWVDVRRQLTWQFWATRILPVGFFMALTLHFGNVVYLYLTVSFIQMLKVCSSREIKSCDTW